MDEEINGTNLLRGCIEQMEERMNRTVTGLAERKSWRRLQEIKEGMNSRCKKFQKTYQQKTWIIKIIIDCRVKKP